LDQLSEKLEGLTFRFRKVTDKLEGDERAVLQQPKDNCGKCYGRGHNKLVGGGIQVCPCLRIVTVRMLKTKVDEIPTAPEIGAALREEVQGA